MTRPLVYNVCILDKNGKPSSTIVFSGTSDTDTDTDQFHSMQNIHLDDSIRTIKNKILIELHTGKYTSSLGLRPFYEELYLYAEIETSVPAKRADLEKVPLGMVGMDDTFEANPFLVKEESEHLTLSYLESRLLLNYGAPRKNTLFLCLASNVLTPYISRYYFPLLYKNGIQTFADLASNRAKLTPFKDTNSKLYESIKTFYDIHADSSTGIMYTTNGIESAQIRISNPDKKPANLEMIFKRIHSSNKIPFIKYNPGLRRENLFRLYFEKTSRNGKKIPYLTKTHLSKLAKETGKSQQISLCILLPEIPTLYLHFEQSGDLLIECAFKEPVSEESLDHQMSSLVNPILAILNRDLRQIGFSVQKYTRLRELEVVSMEYVVKTSAKKPVDMEKIPCIYSICTVNKESVRIKRVENYREMDAANILISEMYGKVQYGDLEIPDIVDALIQRNFASNPDNALQLISEYLTDHTESNGQVLEKPGFPIQMIVNAIDKTMTIRVSNLTSAFYLDTLFVYVDAFVKITQYYTANSIHMKHLKSICAKKYVHDDIVESRAEVIPMNPDAFKPLIAEVDDDFFANLGIADEDEVGEIGVEIDVESDSDLELDNDAAPKKPTKKPIVYEDSESAEPDEPTPEKPTKRPILYSESSEEVSQEGGQHGDDPNLVPDGMPLKNPNPFLTRLKKRDPELFMTNPTGRFSGYSTTCQPVSRHPVVLTQEELDAMPKDSYTHSIKYGSNPNNQHHYVCPQFWCFLTNSAISEEDVKAGKCGNIIPKGEKTVPKGAYVYRLSDRNQIPGFIRDAHPNGHCLPCCFKAPWESKSQKTLRDQCINNEVTTVAKEPVGKAAQYIISLDTYPCPQNRWGFLPIPVQLFLQTNYRSAVDPNNPALIQMGKPALLRFGVEHFPNQ